MCYIDEHKLFRVPIGWDQFNYTDNIKGKSLTKDPVNAQVRGLHYKIEFVKPLVKSDKISSMHYIQLKAWNYNIYNEWQEYTVLSYLLKSRLDKNTPLKQHMSSLKIMSYSFPVTNPLVHRVLATTSFLIKQIENNLVPDPEQILVLHKIHPSQRRFYEEKRLTGVSILSRSKDSVDLGNRKIMQ